MTPPFFRQEGRYTCSLASLRMVLGAFQITVTEQELFELIKLDYGSYFKSIWNPSIARLATHFGLSTTLVADWPLLKPRVLAQAVESFTADPDSFNLDQFEPKPTMRGKTERGGTEPLPIAYRDLFFAVRAGCQARYGHIDRQAIVTTLQHGGLLQTSVRLHKLYPGSQHVHHSVVVYNFDNETVWYHDPARGPAQQTSIKHLLQAADRVGAYMCYQYDSSSIAGEERYR